MIRAAFVPGFVALALAASQASAENPPEIPLWPDGAPGAMGTEAIDMPTIRVYPAPGDRATGAAMVVCPGGGYHVVAIDHEGAQAARELNRRGVTAFVLRYRLKPKYEPRVSLGDAQRAVRWVRANAEKYGVDPHRVGIMGFSAGGHLSSSVATHFDAGKADAPDPVDRQSCRPDFAVLCYPVISKDLYGGAFDSTEVEVTPQTPPTFLFHTTEDTGVPPENSVRFYQALLKAKVPAEFHAFATGPHGVGLAPGAPDGPGQWPELLGRWLRGGKWLTPEPRVTVAGTIKKGGKPIPWAWVTFVPTGPGADRKPVAASFMPGHADGKFSMDAVHGPVAGVYRVEIRNLGTVEPSPTIDDVEVLAGPESGLTVEVKEGASNTFEFDLK